MKKDKNHLKYKIITIAILIIVIFVVVLVNIKKVNNKMIVAKKNNFSFSNTFYVTGKEIVEDMKLGWNLGNSLDCRDGKNQDVSPAYYETLNNQVVTTKAMITEVKNAGFNAVRIPVTWKDHIYIDQSGEKIKDINIDNLSVSEVRNIKIEEDWMNRVKEVVDYVDQNDMYCIINIHHDVGRIKSEDFKPWIYASTDVNNKLKYETILETLWTQIAEEFKDYGSNILFEGYNEIMIENATEWTSATDPKVTADYLNAANDLNEVFVNTVRKSGGNNKLRFLVLNTYAAETTQVALDSFSLPTDTISDHIIISAHLYDWNGECTTGTNNKIYNALQRLKKKADELDTAAIIGEFATKIDIAGDENTATAVNYYVKTAQQLGITCFYWDDGSSSFGLLNRQELSWKHPKIVDVLTRSFVGQNDSDVNKNITTSNENITIDKTSNTVINNTTITNTTTKDTTTTKSLSLPKTGIEKYGVLAIVFIIIISISSFILYKKIEKDVK